MSLEHRIKRIEFYYDLDPDFFGELLDELKPNRAGRRKNNAPVLGHQEPYSSGELSLDLAVIWHWERN